MSENSKETNKNTKKTTKTSGDASKKSSTKSTAKNSTKSTPSLQTTAQQQANNVVEKEVEVKSEGQGHVFIPVSKELDSKQGEAMNINLTINLKNDEKAKRGTKTPKSTTKKKTTTSKKQPATATKKSNEKDKKDKKKKTSFLWLLLLLLLVFAVAFYFVYPYIPDASHHHKYATTWTTNDTSHWHKCTGCEEITGEGEHRYDDDCDATCNDCGYTRVPPHHYEYQTTEETHWLQCEDCLAEPGDPAVHVYGGVCDTTCNVCGYTREVDVSHTITDTWQMDATNHWNECSTCHDKFDSATHTFLSGVCSTCTYEREELEFGYVGSGETATYKVVGIGRIQGTEIVIPDTYDDGQHGEHNVTAIDESAFYNKSNITSVTMSNNITSIGESAFCNCTSLTSITLSTGLKTIGSGAFLSAGITSLVLPEGLESIGMLAFAYSGLKSISIPSTVTNIEVEMSGVYMSPFAICKMETITVAEGNITYRVVNNCLIDIEGKSIIAGTKNSTIPTDSSVATSIMSFAFSGTELTSIVIPSNITSLGDGAFGCCESLESVCILGDSLTTFDSYLFAECSSLQSIVIPSSITSISSDAFDNCPALTTIYYGGTTSEEWATLSSNFSGVSVYYYSENMPQKTTTMSTHWHYEETMPELWNTHPTHSYTNDCDETCDVCGAVRTAPHSPGATYYYDDDLDAGNHWHKCTLCNLDCEHVPHTYSDWNTDTTCDDCGHIRTIVHHYSPDYNLDQHFQKCTDPGCGHTVGFENHYYDNSCDTTCNGCDFTRTISHTWDTGTYYYDDEVDEATHWYKCTVCGADGPRQGHIYADDFASKCGRCDKTRVPPKAQYTVEHYLENKDDNEYTKAEGGSTPNGNTGNAIDIDSIKVASWHIGSYEYDHCEPENPIIAGDGSTVVKLYYKRTRFTLTLAKDEHISAISAEETDVVTSTGDNTYKVKWESKVYVTCTVEGGYRFKGYYFDEELTDERVDTEEGTGKKYYYYTVKQDITITAKSQAVSYGFAYQNRNGASPWSVYPAWSLPYGTILESKHFPSPTTVGYTFEGWYADSALTKKIVMGETPLNAETFEDMDLYPTVNSPSVNVYAKWEPKEYTVQFNGNGSTSGSMSDMTMLYSETKNLPAIGYQKAGYTFDGWSRVTTTAGYLEDGEEVTVSLLIRQYGEANPIILYAIWTPNTNTPYLVKHYKQKIDNWTATDSLTAEDCVIADTESKTGTTGAGTVTTIKSYEGFTSPTATKNVAIAGDGSTVIEYFYARITKNIYVRPLSSPKFTSVTVSGDGVREKERSETYVTYDVRYGATVNLSAVLSCEGYTFTGWTSDYEDWAPANASSLSTSYVHNVNSSFPINANANANKYTISFDTDSTTTLDTQDIYYGNTISTTSTVYLPTITRIGYTFDGWYGDEDFTIKIGGNAFTKENVDSINHTTKTAIFYAKWVEHTYTIAFNSNGGSGDEMASLTNVAYSENKTLTTNTFSRTGYTFAGWSTSQTATTATYTDGGTVSGLSATDGNTVTLYAIWTPNTDTAYKVEYHMQNIENDEYTVDNTKTQNLTGTTGTTATVTAETITGFVYDEDNDLNVTSGTIAGDGSLVLKLYYNRRTGNIIIDKDTGISTVSVTGTSVQENSETIYSVKYGDTVTLSATASDGYTFSGWTRGTGSSATTLTGNTIVQDTASEIYLTANATANTYSLTYVTNGGDSISAVNKTYNTTFTSAELPALTRTGYTFDGWYNDADFTTKVEVVDSLTTSTATFASVATANTTATIYAKWTENK